MRIRGSVLALLAVGAVAIAAQSAHGFGTFRDARTYNTGGEVFGIAAGKLNPDRHVDLLVANDDGDDHISLLRGKGGGKFKPERRIRDPRGPEGLVIARFNRDKRKDFAVADYNSGGESSGVSIYTQRRKTRFRRARSLDAGPGAWLIEVADLNRDGRRDLVTGNFGTDGSDAVTVLLGKGRRGRMQFHPPEDYAAISTTSIVGLGIARMNGDARPDVVTLAADCRLSIYRTNSDGSLSSPTTQDSCASARYQLALGGFDGDAGVDITFGNSVSQVVGAGGDGAGGFNLVTYLSDSVDSPNGIAAGDLNRDGDLDVAVGNGSGSNGFGMQAGLGSRMFEPPDNYSGPDGSNVVELARLNRDRGLDVIVGHDSGIGVYLNRR